MSEIEKMYENAGVKKIELDYPDNFEPFYPEFTAEKQLELIKWLANIYQVELRTFDKFKIIELYKSNTVDGYGSYETFEESLAQAISDIWQDLTEEEKQQIKGILE